MLAKELRMTTWSREEPLVFLCFLIDSRLIMFAIAFITIVYL